MKDKKINNTIKGSLITLFLKRRNFNDKIYDKKISHEEFKEENNINLLTGIDKNGKYI